jgi:hypothetical protein
MRPDRPITRSTLEKITGVPSRTQRSYDDIRLGDQPVVTKQANYLKGVMAQVTDREGFRTMPRQIGNTYVSQVPRHKRASRKRIGDADRHLAHNAVGPSKKDERRQTYFPKGSEYLKASQRGHVSEDALVKVGESRKGSLWQSPDSTPPHSLVRYDDKVPVIIG